MVKNFISHGYIITNRGIIIIETAASPAAAFAELSIAARHIADDAARLVEAWENSKSLNEFVANARWGDLPGGAKVVGAVVFGTAAALATPLWLGIGATTAGGLAASTLVGYVAGKIFELAFESTTEEVRRLVNSIEPKDIKNPVAFGFADGGDFWPGDVPGIGQDAGEEGIQGSIFAPPRYDPLVLDLDGDGIETTGRGDAVVVFDLDGDGVKTGTGWVKPDDGWLVRDLNGNGTIDTGAELFGVDTVKRDGSKARDGFDALADLDANQDGWMDAKDAAFARLRVWRDLNQDGISQPGELQTLAQAGIVAISTGGVAARVDLGNGNIQTAAGSFIRSDGATGSTGETRAKVANLDLMVDTFNRQFTNKIPLSDAARGLPDMRGSGQVRDLREAMSFSPDLAQWVQTYSVQTSRMGQIDLLDGFIQRWADTSLMKSLKEQAQALADSGVSLTYHLGGLEPDTPAHEAFLTKLGIVERFMGFTYGGPRGQARTTALSANEGTLSVSLSLPQINSILQTYELIKGDIQTSLLLATKDRKYLDLIELKLVGERFELDWQAVERAFEQDIALDARDGLMSLVDFISALNTKSGGTASTGEATPSMKPVCLADRRQAHKPTNTQTAANQTHWSQAA
jgi:hypothetical protein